MKTAKGSIDKWWISFFTFIAILILVRIFLHSSLAPEWLTRFILYCLFFTFVALLSLWKGLGSKPIVTKRLMGPEKRTARLIIGSLGRIFCVGLGVFCIWNQLIPVYGKDFPELLNYGSKGLIIKKATVDSVDLGVRGSGWLGMFIHFVGEGPKNDHDYPFSFYQPRIHEGSTWNFLMLENSGIVLEVREQGQKFDL